MQSDVIVIGAGVAGLIAAGEIARQGWSVQLIEARNRTGGRIFSECPRGWPVAIELGAEFVHGGNPGLRKVFKKARIRTHPVEVNVWWRDGRTGVIAHMPNYWEEIGRVVAQIPSRASGWSFQQFLNRQKREISPATRVLAKHYVGGFEAAPTKKISAAALREDHAGTDTNDF